MGGEGIRGGIVGIAAFRLPSWGGPGGRACATAPGAGAIAPAAGGRAMGGGRAGATVLGSGGRPAAGGRALHEGGLTPGAQDPVLFSAGRCPKERLKSPK